MLTSIKPDELLLQENEDDYKQIGLTTQCSICTLGQINKPTANQLCDWLHKQNNPCQ